MTLRRWINPDQTEWLTERYLLLMVGEIQLLLLLLVQAPFIGGMIVLAWKGAKENPTLHLYLCLAALWIGCVNACREIVKERPIFERERQVGLEIVPYLLSKMIVLGGLTLLQSVTMIWIVHYHVGLSGSSLLLVLVLWIISLAGTVLGLALSSFVDSSDKAVGLVPIAILPQILFTRPFLPSSSEEGFAGTMQDLTLLEWGYELYDHVRKLGFDPQYLEISKCVGAMFVLSGALVVATLFLLGAEEDSS